MDVGAPLVADGQAAEAVEPGQRALDHPAVAAQPLAGVSMPLRAMRTLDAALAAGRGDSAGCRRPCRRAAWPGACAAGRAGCLIGGMASSSVLEDRCESWRLAAVTGARASGMPPPVDHNVALRARFAAIRRVRPGALAPLLAGMLALSRLARLQSIWSASPRRSSSTRCKRVPDARPPASRAAAASRSCPSRSPSPGAASPRGCRTSAQR